MFETVTTLYIEDCTASSVATAAYNATDRATGLDYDTDDNGHGDTLTLALEGGMKIATIITHWANF